MSTGNGSGMTVNVDENIIRPVVEAEIQAAIVRQLSNAENLIPALVRAALNEKVDSQGKRSNSSYDAKYTYIEILCNNAVQEAARAGMENYIKENTPIIQAEVERQVKAQSKDIARIFVEGLVESIKSSWSFKVEVSLPDRRDR